MTDREITQLQETGSVLLPRGVTLAEITEGVNVLGIDEDRVELSPSGVGNQGTVVMGIQLQVQP